MTAKKNKNTKASKPFSSNPFSTLKGFSASPEPEQKKALPESDRVQPVYGSFADEMEFLGVERTEYNRDLAADFVEDKSVADVAQEPETKLSDGDLFLSAVGEMNVSFVDHFPDDEEPVFAQPRRLRQLRKGKIMPDQSIDLHGMQRSEVAAKLKSFIVNSRFYQHKVLLVITGKGLHSENGKAVLRDEVERFLKHEGRSFVIEWGRAPKNYGGEGALVLFLREL
jgi:DNA-nicking Smr family endonuclease